MCGRYPSPSAKELNEVWGSKPHLRDEDIPWVDSPNYDARPTQSLPIVRTDPEMGLVIEYARWGLVPVWWKKPLKELGSTINATAEKIKAKSGMWWGPFQRKRCLVPALGFYEWQLQADGKTKVRHFIKLRDSSMMSFAGVWDTWKQPDGSELHSYAIVTCPANPLMAKIHNNARNSDGPRMPVILSGETAAAWHSPTAGLEPPDLLEFLKPYDQKAMLAYPVISTATKASDLVKPIGEEVAA